MKAFYTGKGRISKHRIAEIYFTAEEDALYCKVEDLMLERGWDMRGNVCGDGYYFSSSCKVADRDSFNLFMEDWKECKKEAKKLLDTRS